MKELFEFLYYIGYRLDKHYKLKRQRRLPYPVISIGNITVGGSGKTPATIALAEEAKKRGFQPVILTRGYKGKVKGPCFVTSSPQNFIAPTFLYGDEPVLMAKRLKDVPIVKCADRYEGGMFAISSLQHFSALIFILDDGFQHWKLYRDVDIVLIDGMNPFGNKKMLPLGHLREPLKELKRADIFVITKTPANKERILNELKEIHPDAPVYLSEYKMLKIKDASGNDIFVDDLKHKKVFAFCGIANPESFKQNVLSTNLKLCGFKAYRDHYRYSELDMNYIEKQGKDLDCDFLITTEKDMVKLKELKIPNNLLYIEIGFDINKGFFDYLFKKIENPYHHGGE